MTDPAVPQYVPVTPAVDAKNRALRTFLMGLGFDVLVTVALLLLSVFAAADSWSSFDWVVLGFLFVKTVVVSIASYVLRYFGVGKGTLPPAGEG